MIVSYFEVLWSLTLEMSPYLLLGFLMAGIIKVFLPDRYISRYMGVRNRWSPINAALLGVPMPLCSCGVIPTAVSLYKNGAGKGASVSFLISTPQTGLDSIFVTYSLLGLPFAILRPVIAFITGIIGGYITNFADKKNDVVESLNVENCKIEEKQNVFVRLIRYAFDEFLMDIAKWLVIGLFIAAAITVAIPDGFFEKYMEYKVLSLLAVLIASTPMYICATASVPIAAALMLKGLSPGAALVLLMAGPATNAATIALVHQTLGSRAFWSYLLSITLGALFFGYLIDLIMPEKWFVLNNLHLEHHHHETVSWINIVSAILFLSALLRLGYKRLSKVFRAKKSNITTRKYVVEGMGCRNCLSKIEDTIVRKGVAQVVTANHSTNSVEISGENIDDATVETIITQLGYKYVGRDTKPKE